MKSKQTLLESWVKKEEIENIEDLLGQNKGFYIDEDNPKLFTVGRRTDIEEEISHLEFPSTYSLYLY